MRARPTAPVISEKSLGKLIAFDRIKNVIVSADSNHAAFIGIRGNKECVVRDNVEGPAFDWIIADSLAMNADGSRLAYVVQTSSDTIAVVDGQAGKPCYGIGGNRVFLSHRPQGYAYVELAGDGSAAIVADGVRGLSYEKVDLLIYSPDGNHLAYRATRGPRQRVVRDGVPQAAYDAIVDRSLIYSADSKHLAYDAVVGGKHLVVADQTESRPYDAIRLGPGFSAAGSRLATIVDAGGKSLLLLDGKEQTPFDAISITNLAFSPDSSRIAYGVKREGKTQIVLDGVLQEAFDALGDATLRFSDDSRHVAYQAIAGGKNFVVLDGEKLDSFDGTLAGTPVFSPDSSRLLFGARQGKKWVLVVVSVATRQRTEGSAFDALLSPVFSPDAKRVAFRAGDGNQLFAVIDGAATPAYDAIATIVFSPDSKHVVYMARHEGHSRLVIDQAESPQLFDLRLSADKAVFDDDTHFHLLATRGGEILRVSVQLPP